MAAIEEIRVRLEENPASFTVRELLDIMTSAFDRSVAPVKRNEKIDQKVTLCWAQMVEESQKMIVTGVRSSE